MGQISEWVLAIMDKFGYLGIIFAMFAENVFPPIPSEVIMPAAGFAVARGDLNLVMVVVAGTLGSVLGALPLYYLGSLFNKDRLISYTEKYGKFVFVTPDDVISANDWFNKHGKKAVFLGRMVPGIRSLISIPAGMNTMPLLPFIIYTTAGAAIWTTLLTVAGYHFGQNYEVIQKFLAPFSKIFLGLAIVIIIIWLFRKRSAQSN